MIHVKSDLAMRMPPLIREIYNIIIISLKRGQGD